MEKVNKEAGSKEPGSAKPNNTGEAFGIGARKLENAKSRITEE